jgi:nanoRNase/pAp phosphatase (c-di-AMP/oligoRNAs hydrolase)
MEQKHHVSEVARTRANIQAECEALRHLMLFSQSATHEIIRARFQALDAHHQQLRAVMPEEEATSLLVGIYTDVVQ